MSTPRRPAPRSSAAPITATPRSLLVHRGKASLRNDGSARAAGARNIRVVLADDDRPSAGRSGPDRAPARARSSARRDGLEAIELAEELEPDAVVLDLHMPLLDGVAAAARLRPTTRAVPDRADGGRPSELHAAVRRRAPTPCC